MDDKFLRLRDYYHDAVYKEALSRFKNLISPPPTQWVIEPCRQCNLKCTYCSRNSQYVENTTHWRLDSDLIYGLEYELSYAQHVAFCGIGEALFYNELFDLIKFVRKINKTCMIAVATNGSRQFTDEEIFKLNKYRVAIIFSLDNTDYEINEMTRPGSDANKIMKNIEHLTNKKEQYNYEYPSIVLISVITKYIMGHLKSLLEFCLDVGCMCFNLQKLNIFWDVAQSFNREKIITEGEDIKILNNEIDELFDIIKDHPDFLIDGSYLYHHYKPISEHPLIKKFKCEPCLDPWVYSQVFSSGGVMPCAQAPHPSGILYDKKRSFDEVFDQSMEICPDATQEDYDNVKTWLELGYQPFMELWNNTFLLTLRNEIKTNKLNDNCKLCIERGMQHTWYVCT